MKYAILLVLASVFVLGTVGCKSQTPESELNSAASAMNAGYQELGKMDNKLDAGNSKSAMSHLNKALNHFNKAMVDYSKAELPAGDQPAIDALKKGLDDLQACVTAVERNDMTAAQKYYDDAQSNFSTAESLAVR